MPIYNARLQKIDAAETRRYTGLMRAKDFDQQMIDEACEEALLLAEPRGIYQIYDYDCQRQLVIAEPSFQIAGQKIGQHLSGCEQAIVLAVTVGSAIEQQVARCFEVGRYAYSVLLDAAATTAVEQAADELEKAIKPQASAQGYAMRWRFSPGYGDWPLAQQPEMLRLSHADEINISLTESLMLQPRKSITAIIGLYRPESTAGLKTRPGCNNCTQKDCPSRRIAQGTTPKYY